MYSHPPGRHRDHRDRVGLFNILPPTLLPPLTEDEKIRKDLHRKLPTSPFKCDPHSDQALLLPILVMGHWMLAVIHPQRSRGSLTIVSSRRSCGIAAVKKAIRATLGTENTPLRCLEGPPIVSWDIHYPCSPKESSRSVDGGIYILLHIAGFYSKTPPPEVFDTSRVRAILNRLVTTLRNLISSDLKQRLPPNPRLPRLASTDRPHRSPLTLFPTFTSGLASF